MNIVTDLISFLSRLIPLIWQYYQLFLISDENTIGPQPGDKGRLAKRRLTASSTEGLLQHSRQHCMPKIKLSYKGINQDMHNVL